jgi:oxygen-independent coproporphyrinogen-3 oxidase
MQKGSILLKQKCANQIACKLRTLHELSGLYIHIPFCKSACTYCNFHFTTGSRYRDSFIQQIIREYELQSHAWQEPWDTVYLGGGTPSILPESQIELLFRHIAKKNGLVPGAEITIEANPEDIQPQKIQAWLAMGINRVSLGVQSLSDTELKAMNRVHRAEDSLKSLALLNATGFPSVNIDLIYGSQWLSDTDWEHTLRWAFDSGADHISAYALTAETNTKLFKDISKGTLPPISEEKQAKHFEMLHEMAAKSQWDFYEISNLSKPGHRAKHNSNYWKNKPYLGLGPSAHSYDGQFTRRWNIADNKQYVESIEQGLLNFEEEILNESQLFNEFLLTNLRTVEGVSLSLAAKLQPNWLDKSQHSIAELSNKHFLLQEEGFIKLTMQGKLLSDYVTRELML